MSLRSRSLFALLLLSSLSVSRARAEESDRNHPPAPDDGAENALCVRAYEQAQEQRHTGKLLEARVQLQSCARDACPKFIRSDCANWYGELQTEMPSVVFAARSAGRDLTDVQVSFQRRLLASRIDGEAIELDPGEYDFEFRSPGMQPLTQHVLISRGERNRLQRAELLPVAKVAAAPDEKKLPPPTQRSWLLPGVLGGVAVVGLSSFVAFGVWGHSAESKLETSCSPNCSKDQISSVKTKYVVADVSLAVGVVGLGLATYLALSSGPEQRAAHALPFNVQASAQGVTATYQEAF
ncbi:MAG TPA: hypothetical protein VER12_12910 [Polyangiaceae bacterium]|nr:hypothetical protein [Polyangiaceae bacterium]